MLIFILYSNFITVELMMLTYNRHSEIFAGMLAYDLVKLTCQSC